MIRAYYLYTGEDGHSYFKSGSVNELTWTETTSISFRETPAGSAYEWHTAPAVQYVLTLSGELEFTTSKGEIFILKTGDVLIATDITGKGHRWRIIGDDPWKRTYVKFDKVSEFNFLPD
jgi:quercetin dioxygenase-like cupin family protein